MAKKKSSTALTNQSLPLETLAKVDALAELFAKGGTEFDLRNAIAEQMPGEDPELLIGLVINRLVSHSTSERAEALRFGFVVEAAMSLYQDCRTHLQFKSALDTLKFISELRPPESENAE